MKKLFSFISVFALAAILGVSSVSAQKTTLAIEKLWSITEPGGGAARQGFGMDGALYYHQSGKGVYKVASATATPELIIDATVTGIVSHSVAKDDAGNIVVFGSTGFPTGATSELFIYVQKKGEATGAQVTCPALEGFNRLDFIAAAGDVFSAEGGHLYLINNDGKAAFDITIVNGATATATPIAGMTLGASQNAMMDVHDGIYHYASAGSGVYSFDGTTATKVDGLTDIQAQCLGTTHFTLAGKEMWVYHVGGNYTSEFKVLNKTDNNFVSDKDGNVLFVLHDAAKASGGALRGVWFNTEKIDDNNYLLYAWHSHDGGAVYKVSAVVAATVTLNVNDATMGTVEGAGDVAVGASATVKAIPAIGHSFVAWMNGTDTVATTAEYTFEVKEDVTLTAVFQKENDVKLTLAVNDAAAGSITLPEGIVMGENTVAYGTVVTLTAVPVEGATLNGWYNGETLYSTDYTINVPMTADMALTAKFVKVLTLAYELNGGVTNDYGWTSKGALMLEIQEDYNATYSASLAVVKEENGVYYFNINGEWMTEYEAQAKGYNPTVGGFFQAKTFSYPDNPKVAKLILDSQKDKYAFLVELIDNFMNTAASNRGTSTIAEMKAADDKSVAENPDDRNKQSGVADAYLRAEISGFMLNSPAASGYPYTCNWAQAGLPESYTKVWKHAFANPTEIKGEVVLNVPYKEGMTFDGWYTNPEFTGDPVVTVSPESVIEGGKLYAKWIEYIPTIAEVREMEVGTEVKVKVVVNHVGGNTIYIEDASSMAMDVYMKNSGLQTGQEAVIVGTITNAKGWPRLEGKEVVSTKEGKLFEPVDINFLDTLVNDTTYKYYAKRVAISGLTIAKYAENGDVYFTDGKNEVQGYYMKLDQTTFPVGTVVNINGAIAAWYDGFQFTGDAATVSLAPKGLVDTYEYPTRHEKYTLKNEWIFSTQDGNYKGNEPGANDMVRGMVARDGKLYFADRGTSSIIVVDGATGEKLEPIKVKGEHLFERQKEDGTWEVSPVSCQYPFQDIKMDQAGNCLIGACLTSIKQNFYIYTVDLATGEATELINECLLDNPEFAGLDLRFDAFGVAGDVKGNACIMAADSKDGFRVYRWLIKEGKAGKAELITLKPTAENSLAVKNNEITGLGTAPQIFPQDELGEYFYVDGASTLPMLFDERGVVIEDFIKCKTGITVVNNEGDTIKMNATQPNGVCEFELNGEYFMVMAAEYVTDQTSAKFAIYKFDNAYRQFKAMEPLWYFPNKGMGKESNQGRSAVPYVDVVGNTAHIYVYVTNNGYAAYTLTVGGTTDVENIEEIETMIGAEKVLENGQVFIIKNGVKYNVLGAQVK